MGKLSRSKPPFPFPPGPSPSPVRKSFSPADVMKMQRVIDGPGCDCPICRAAEGKSPFPDAEEGEVVGEKPTTKGEVVGEKPTTKGEVEDRRTRTAKQAYDDAMKLLREGIFTKTAYGKTNPPILEPTPRITGVTYYDPVRDRFIRDGEDILDDPVGMFKGFGGKPPVGPEDPWLDAGSWLTEAETAWMIAWDSEWWRQRNFALWCESLTRPS